MADFNYYNKQDVFGKIESIIDLAKTSRKVDFSGNRKTQSHHAIDLVHQKLCKNQSDVVAKTFFENLYKGNYDVWTDRSLLRFSAKLNPKFIRSIELMCNSLEMPYHIPETQEPYYLSLMNKLPQFIDCRNHSIILGEKIYGVQLIATIIKLKRNKDVFEIEKSGIETLLNHDIDVLNILEHEHVSRVKFYSFCLDKEMKSGNMKKSTQDEYERFFDNSDVSHQFSYLMLLLRDEKKDLPDRIIYSCRILYSEVDVKREIFHKSTLPLVGSRRYFNVLFNRASDNLIIDRFVMGLQATSIIKEYSLTKGVRPLFYIMQAKLVDPKGNIWGFVRQSFINLNIEHQVNGMILLGTRLYNVMGYQDVLHNIYAFNRLFLKHSILSKFSKFNISEYESLSYLNKSELEIEEMDY